MCIVITMVESVIEGRNVEYIEGQAIWTGISMAYRKVDLASLNT